MLINDYAVCLTQENPEQYDVFKDNIQVGHIELRGRQFIVLGAESGKSEFDVTLVSAIVDGDNMLLPHERDEWLKEAVKHLDNYLCLKVGET